MSRWYKISDRKYPSVTSVLDVISKGEGLLKWACDIGYAKSRQTLRDAAQRGQTVHRVVASKLCGQDASDEAEKYIGYVESAGLLINEWKLVESKKLVEQEVASDQHSFAGTVDYVGECDGKVFILDWKTSNSLHEETALQTAAYLIAVNERYPQLKVTHRYAARLKEDGSRPQVKEYDLSALPEDFNGFLGALRLFNWVNRRQYLGDRNISIANSEDSKEVR